MTEQTNQVAKSGLKSLNKFNEIPMVNSAYTTVGYYYDLAKKSNVVVRTSLNIAEYSAKVGLAITAPIVNYVCEKPINTVDEFLSAKIDAIEKKFPVVTKPTNELITEATTQVESVYTKNIQPHLNKTYEVVKYSGEKLSETKTFVTTVYTKNIQPPLNKTYEVVKYSGEKLSETKSFVTTAYSKTLKTPVDAIYNQVFIVACKAIPESVLATAKLTTQADN